MSIELNGTTGIDFNDGSNQSTAATPYGRKNLIINGDMRIDQRNGGASVTPSSDSYTLDRWIAGMSAGSKFSVEQSTTAPTGFTNSVKITSLAATSLSAGDYYSIEQSIEGYNIANLNYGSANAVTITLSFWTRSSLTGTFGGSLRGASSTRSYPFTYTISAADTWEYKTVTISGVTSGTWIVNNGKGLSVIFGLGVGTTYSGTAGSWASSNYLSATGATSVVGTSGATWYITGVQLEVGDAASDFEFMPYDMELQRCQRYCWVASDLLLGTSRNATDLYKEAIYHPVPMRASPSITNSSFNAHTGSNGTVGLGQTRFVGSQGTLGVAVWNSANNWTTGAWIAMSGVISAEL